MTNQDAMRIKRFLEKVLDRRNEMITVQKQGDVEVTAYNYAHVFTITSIEAHDLLGEIEWPDQEEKK